MIKIIIVEDDIVFGTIIQTWLQKKGFETDKVTSVRAAVKLLQTEGHIDLILSDLRLPDHDGLFLLQWLKEKGMNIPFIIMTSYAEVQNAVQAMKLGATDYIAKPFQPDILLQKIKDALPQPSTKPMEEKHENHTATSPQYIEGESEASRQLYELVSLVAPTPMSVLILGASGTGKEHIAHRIHEMSKRADKPFFALDCGAIPKDVAASEFFGHKKGAFTGADQDKKGAFELANGGTLFLDEMGNLNYEVQVQLLRALQERKIRPLGGTQEVDIDIRLVCATNENLEQRVAEGLFREDLYHRISEFTIFMPELKDRGADIFLFANFFMQHANKELGRNLLGFDSKAMDTIASYSWPGNLRELNNVVKRATLLAKGNHITATDLERTMNTAAKVEPLALHDRQTEQQRIETALRTTHGNKSKAAQLLGIDRKTLYNKMQRYGMKE